MNEIQLTLFTALIVVVYAILLLLDGNNISVSFLGPMKDVSGILVILLAIFNKWAWRWRFFYPWLVRKPYIQGTWKGFTQSDWIDPETHLPVEPIPAFLVIVQDYSKINAFLLTLDSRSDLISGDIVRKNDGDFQLTYVYRNTPKLLIRETSPIHYGGVILDISTNPKIGLEGQYWTDRKTKGQLVFDSFSKEKYSTFEGAMQGVFTVRKKF